MKELTVWDFRISLINVLHDFYNLGTWGDTNFMKHFYVFTPVA